MVDDVKATDQPQDQLEPTDANPAEEEISTPTEATSAPPGYVPASEVERVRRGILRDYRPAHQAIQQLPEGLREAFLADPLGTLKAIAEIGGRDQEIEEPDVKALIKEGFTEALKEISEQERQAAQAARMQEELKIQAADFEANHPELKDPRFNYLKEEVADVWFAARQAGINLSLEAAYAEVRSRQAGFAKKPSTAKAAASVAQGLENLPPVLTGNAGGQAPQALTPEAAAKMSAEEWGKLPQEERDRLMGFTR